MHKKQENIWAPKDRYEILVEFWKRMMNPPRVFSTISSNQHKEDPKTKKLRKIAAKSRKINRKK
jgi:hypothetical protein